MANAYSQLHNYDRELQTYDFNLIADALSAKEQGLAQGRAMVDQADNMLDQLGLEIDERRPQDREYFQQRYNQAKSVVDKYRAGDLSDPNLANQLVNKLAETMKDERLVNAVVGSKQRKAELQAWAKLREEEPDKFYEGNYALSQQNAEEWYANEAVGAKYKGGGGVREYYDYHKIVNENIGEIAKLLNAKYVRTVDGGGKFYSLDVSGQEVDRGQLRGAIESLVGEKGRQQMAIEAWYNFDNVDNETLRAQYTNFLQPRLEEADKYVKYYETKLNTLTEGTEEYNSIKSKLASARIFKTDVESRNWDNLMKGGEESGRKSAYTTMHRENTIGKWVDSYALSSVDSKKVNDLSYKEQEQENWIREFALKKRKEDRLDREQLIRAAGEGIGTGTPGNGKIQLPGGGQASLGQNVDVDPKDLSNELEQIDAIQREGLESMTKLVGQDLNESELASIIVQFGEGMMDKIADSNTDKVSFEVGGKEVEIELTDENMGLIMDFYGKAVKTPPQMEIWREESLNEVQKIQTALAKQAAETPGGFVGFPNYDFAIKEVREGDGEIKYYDVGLKNQSHRDRFNQVLREGQTERAGTGEYNVVDTPEDNNYLNLLIKKGEGKALTPLEQKNLDLYTRMHMINDTGIDEPVRKHMLRHLREDVAKNSKDPNTSTTFLPAKVGDRVRESALKHIEEDEATRIRLMGLSYFNPSVLTPKPDDVDINKKDYRFPTQISDFGMWLTDYEGEEQSITSMISNMNDGLLNQASNRFKGMSEGISQRELIIDKKGAPTEYEILTSEIVRNNKIEKSKIGDDIRLYRDLDENYMPTDKFHYSMSYKDEDGKIQVYDSKKSGGAYFTKDYIDEKIGANFSKQVKDPVYSAYSFGEHAATVRVGNSGEKDEENLRQLSIVSGDPAIIDNSLFNMGYINNLFQTDSQGKPLPNEEKEVLMELAKGFKRGDYRYELVPVKNVGYLMQMYKGDTEIKGAITREPVVGRDATSEEMGTLLRDPNLTFIKQGVLIDYLQRVSRDMEFNRGRNER